MNKKMIRLTENDLHKIVKESVKRILRENDFMQKYFSDNDFYKNRQAHHAKINPYSPSRSYSSDDVMKLHDYDPEAFPAWHERNLSGTHNDFYPGSKDGDSWNTFGEYDDRLPIDPSPENKQYQINSAWDELAYDNKNKNGKVHYYGDDRDYWDTNLNIYDTSEDGWGLDFDDNEKLRPTWRQSKNAGRPDVEQEKYINPSTIS